MTFDDFEAKWKDITANALETVKNYADEYLIKKPEFQYLKMNCETKIGDNKANISNLLIWKKDTDEMLEEMIGSLRTKLDKKDVDKFTKIVEVLPTMDQFTTKNREQLEQVESFRNVVD